MKLALISCMVLSRDISYCMYKSQNSVHAFWLEQGLHDTPAILHQSLQEKINYIEMLNEKFDYDKRFDAIILGYGLCSNGIIGLKSTKLQIVAPRCDDCIALFLGSQERYLNLFHSKKGIYWFNKPWIENAFIPSKENYDKLHAFYLNEYGEENADYLIEEQTRFTQNYENAVFIKSDIYDDAEEVAITKKNADYFNWNYLEENANISFLMDLIDGRWDDKFLICKPNQTIAVDYSHLKIRAEGDISVSCKTDSQTYI